MRLAKGILKNLDIESSRKYQDILGDLSSKALAGKVRFENVGFENFEAAMALPEDTKRSGAVFLYLHGGAYTAGSLSYAKGFGGVVAERFSAPCLCAAYRLAPEHPFPAALDDAVSAYAYLCERHDPRRLFLIGESAGGGLCFSLILRIIEKRLPLPLPAGLITISPWTDLTLSGASVNGNAQCDPSLSEKALMHSAGLYAGDVGTDNPLVAPLFSDLSSFPPCMVFAGGSEILRDDGTRIAEKLTASGSKCELYVEEGLWHAYVLFPVPEAKNALDRIETFVRDLLDDIE